MKKILVTILVMLSFSLMAQQTVVYTDTLVGETGQDTVFYEWSVIRYYVDFTDNFMRWDDECKITYKSSTENYVVVIPIGYELSAGDSVLYNDVWYHGVDVYDFVFDNSERVVLRNINKNMIITDPRRFFRKQ